MKRGNLSKRALVYKSVKTWRFTAVVASQGNSTMQILWLLDPTFGINGPENVTPGTYTDLLVQYGMQIGGHTIQKESSTNSGAKPESRDCLFYELRARNTQKRSRKWLIVLPTLLWNMRLCTFITISFVKWWQVGRLFGCVTSTSALRVSNLPPTRSFPASFMYGCNEDSSECGGKVSFLWPLKKLRSGFALFSNFP